MFSNPLCERDVADKQVVAERERYGPTDRSSSLPALVPASGTTAAALKR
jgi:hypothetical protein